MKYFIIAGEASGDLHGSNLIKHLIQLDSQAAIQGWGGQLMQQQGMSLKKHYKDLAFMGFIEVVKNLSTIIKNFSIVKQQIAHFQPDVVILIDYPGFNLRLAKWLKQQHYKVFYYISPQLWAWKENRVKQVRQYVDKMFCILPFEESFYAKHQIAIDYVGHPLLDAIDTFKDNTFLDKHYLNSGQPIIALLPGSRKQEINKILPVFLEVAASFKEHQFVIAGLEYLGNNFYHSFSLPANCKIVYGNTYALLQHASAALVTSGTATLETALFEVPQIVCYKGSWFSYVIGKQLIKVPYISLVNLICNKTVVTELIQDACNANNITQHLKSILQTETRNTILSDYQNLKILLGGKGASERAANLMIKYLQHKQI